MYKTGHSLIKAKMKQEHAELAGENSGHMFFADRYYGYDDALYTACRLIEIVAKSGKPLSAQLTGIPQMVSTPEIRVDTPDEVKFDVVARVAEHFPSRYKTIDIDGVRVIFPHGWGPGARAQHAAGARDALRSGKRGVAMQISERKGRWWWKRRRRP
jgi:phosphomannomutase/phosphoglucomutase